jgi:transposase-like protein
MARHPDHGKERRWLDLIHVWQGSRLSVRAFCRRQRLSEPTFYAWRRVLRERGLIADERSGAAVSPATSPVFVKVAVDASASARAAIDLVVAKGRRLRIHPGFDADLLRQLLRVLEEPSC